MPRLPLEMYTNMLKVKVKMGFILRATKLGLNPVVIRPAIGSCFSSSSESSPKEAVNAGVENAKFTKKKVLEEVPDAQVHWEYHQTAKAKIYDKKPIRVGVKQGKVYMWCACGHSKSQPFCDGTHRLKHLKIELQPVPWTATETKDVWFCACKQTARRPFCDGTHKEKVVADADDVTIKY